MGYVWCDGYVWDMCGVRYANNLLKNPATKRLSGKTRRANSSPEPQKKHLTFHYTGWLMGILIMACYNP